MLLKNETLYSSINALKPLVIINNYSIFKENINYNKI